MKTLVQIITLLMSVGFVHAQTITDRLKDAATALEKDSQMENGILGFYVVDQRTDKLVFAKNAAVGLAMASSQKVITSAATLEMLTTTYRYKTVLGYSGAIQDGELKGNIYLIGYGDPTLGSWRYPNTKEQVVLDEFTQALQQAGIQKISGDVIIYNRNWESQTIPGGWIWDDIGNYYGAGVSSVNWRENQYDLNLRSGSKVGDKVSIVSSLPKIYGVNFINELLTGEAGSGDNAYIYLPPYSTVGYIRGTIPPGKSSFTISGSFPNPSAQLTLVISAEFAKHGIHLNTANRTEALQTSLPKVTTLLTHLSPSLDSMNFWFLRKSINLYGEALVKTLGYEKKQAGSTEAGLSLIKNFWSNNGIQPNSINIMDGSGLSPQNRITPVALVKVMQFARSRPWFNAFYNALPEFNGIKMKSGTIGGVKSFTGYVGNYTFAIVVNNYNGSTGEIVRKMYRVLDVLK